MPTPVHGRHVGQGWMPLERYWFPDGGHILRQIEPRRDPCAQEPLSPAGEGRLLADPEPALACPLLGVPDEVAQESLLQLHLACEWGLAHDGSKGLHVEEGPVDLPGQAQADQPLFLPRAQSGSRGGSYAAKEKAVYNAALPLPVTLEG